MAVLEAVRGWEFHAGLPHIGVEEDNAVKEEGKDEEEGEKKEEEEEVLEEGMWSKDDLEGRKLDELLETDYVGLLFEHDKFASGNSRASLRECLFLLFVFLLLCARVFGISRTFVVSEY
jgi:protein kinase C substrate 80K-H